MIAEITWHKREFEKSLKGVWFSEVAWDFSTPASFFRYLSPEGKTIGHRTDRRSIVDGKESSFAQLPTSVFRRCWICISEKCIGLGILPIDWWPQGDTRTFATYRITGNDVTLLEWLHEDVFGCGLPLWWDRIIILFLTSLKS